MHPAVAVTFRHLLVNDPAPGGHPLDVAAAVACRGTERVGVVDESAAHERDRLESTVRVGRKAGNRAAVVHPPTVLRLEVVAERTAGELTGGLGLGECRDADWTPPVLLVSARDGVGIEALAEAIGAHFKHLSAGGRLGARRRLGVETWLLRALESRYGSYGIEQLGGKTAVRARLDAGGSAFAALARLAAEIEETLGKPR